MEKADKSNKEKKKPSSKTSSPPKVDTKSEEQEFKTKYLYLMAEFDNFRKKSSEKILGLQKYNGELLAKELLNIIDIFEKALSDNKQNTDDSFVKGIKATFDEFSKILKDFGIVEVNISPGDDFDSTIAEALGTEKSTEIKSSKVLKVYQKAYKLGDKILRYAKVILSE